VAEYIFKFHDSTGSVIDQYPVEIWQGNRDKSNRQALALGTTIYSWLVYRDDESQSAMWLALGNSGELWLDVLTAQNQDVDWLEAAVSVDYLLAGRTKTAVFTRSYELGQQLSSETFILAAAEKTFATARGGTNG
jgi:hypothetical protein